MAKKKELSEDLRLRIATAHHEGKGYKAFYKQFIVPIATVQSNIKKYKKFHTVKTLVKVDGIMKKEQYIEIFEENIKYVVRR